MLSILFHFIKFIFHFVPKYLCQYKTPLGHKELYAYLLQQIRFITSSILFLKHSKCKKQNHVSCLKKTNFHVEQLSNGGFLKFSRGFIFANENLFRVVFKAWGVRPVVFCINWVLRSFAKCTGNHLCQSFFFNKVAGLRPATLLKRRLWHSCFPVSFAKFLRRVC